MDHTPTVLTPASSMHDDADDGVDSSDSNETSSQTQREDKIFDRIEDILAEYMHDSSRHYLHFRLLRWTDSEDFAKIFTAVVLINPPMSNQAIGP